MLELTGISRTYDDGHPVHALRTVDVHLHQGDYIAITGESGSGKSTLLNVLGLLDVPSSGSYRLCGVEMVDAPETIRESVRGQMFGFVFQRFHLLPGRSALENVEIGMLYGPGSRRDRRQRAAESLERVGLAGRMNADPRKLSGGERQRVAIARAVAASPEVLFCDEPTGNLDRANTANVLQLLREINTAGMTIVVVTHDHRVAGQGRRTLNVIDGHVREES